MDVGGEGHNRKYVCAHALENGTQHSKQQISKSVNRAECSCVSSSARTSGVWTIGKNRLNLAKLR